MSNGSTKTGEGWLVFSGIILAIMGIHRIFDALWAFKYDDDYPKVQTLLFEKDLSTYGWFFLIVGVVLLFAGYGVMVRQQWARWVGIIVASVAMLTAMPWLYFQPIWALVVITMGMLVVYGLAAYGGND